MAYRVGRGRDAAQGRRGEAERSFRTALDVARTIRHGKLYVATSALDLAEAMGAQDRPAEAEPLANEALEIHESNGGRDRLEMFRALADLAFALKEQKRGALAEAPAKRALSIIENAEPVDESRLAYALTLVGTVYVQQRRYDDARAMYQRAIALWEKSSEPGHLDPTWSMSSIAWIECEQGNYTKAAAQADRVLELRERSLGPNDPMVAQRSQIRDTSIMSNRPGSRPPSGRCGAPSRSARDRLNRHGLN